MNRNEGLLLLTVLASLTLPLGLALFEFPLRRPLLLAALVGIPVVFAGFFAYNAFRYYR